MTQKGYDAFMSDSNRMGDAAKGKVNEYRKDPVGSFSKDSSQLASYVKNNPARAAGNAVGAIGVFICGGEGSAAEGATNEGSNFSAAATASEQAASIRYGALDELGRATKVEATLTEDILRTGTKTVSSVTPVGYEVGMERGHLLARVLGGSGTTLENLAPIFRSTNLEMANFERQITVAVSKGEIVNLTVKPVYSGSELIPQGVELSAQGNEGTNIAVTVLNK